MYDISCKRLQFFVNMLALGTIRYCLRKASSSIENSKGLSVCDVFT